jgi:hypothetical protein
LYHWVMKTPSWVDLDCTSRAAYVELLARYSGTDDKGFSNNGRIPMSLTEMASALHISKQTAMRALASLEDHGFVAIETKGRFTTGHRVATEYRLTEFPCFGKAATKEFSTWQKAKAGSTTKPDRVSRRTQTGFDMEQVPKRNRPYGSTTTPEGRKSGSTTKPLVVYQGEGRAASPEQWEAQPAKQASPSKASAQRSGQAAIREAASDHPPSNTDGDAFRRLSAATDGVVRSLRAMRS